MKKKTTIIFSLIIAVTFLLAACANNSDLTLPQEQVDADLPSVATPGAAPNNDSAIIVMIVNGENVYKDKYDAAYSSVCNNLGLSENDTSFASLLQQSAIELLLSEEVMLQKLEELGYMDLSEEDMQSAKDQAQGELDYVTFSATESILAGLPDDYTEQEMDDAITAYEDQILSQYGLTRESFLEYFTQGIALQNAQAELLKDVVPTDEEVMAQYENTLAADEEAIGSDLSVYDTYLASYQESYYIPEGVRYVRHVLIALDDELATEISTTRTNDGDEAADKLRDESLLTIEEKANEVLSLLQNGEITFTDAIAEYNDDPGMEYYPEGYEIYSGCTLYVPEFTESAMSLENIGDITGLVATDYGYHIIEYTTDRTSGPVAFESVQQDIYDNLLPTLQDEAWQALLDQWVAEADYTVYNENI